ncbi:unnamed protein product [Calypogeia fissa]
MDARGNGHAAGNGHHHNGGASLGVPLLESRSKEDVGLLERPALEEIRKEAKHQVRLGTPVVMMGVLDFSVILVSVGFVGRLGALPLAGAAMAASFANVFGFAILEGLSGGLETSAGQAHGAGQHQLTGLLLQRGILVLLMFCIPISVLWLYSPAVLLFWGQAPEIVELSGQYVLYMLPGLFATACFLPVVKFLQVQGITAPLAIIACIVLCLHIPLCWFFIYAIKLGFIGAAIATSASNTCTLILLVLYLNFEPSGILERTWPGWTLAASRNLGPFLSLALPACAMTSFEWWVFEIVQIMAGWLPHPDVNVAAMTISFQTTGLCFMLPLGLATAVGVRVANELGAQRPGRARWAVYVGMVLATIVGGILAIVLLVSRNEWALLFTNPSETEVVRLVASVMPCIVLSIVGVSWSTVLSGVLRGSGQQFAGSIVNGVALYGIALPAAYYIGIRKQLGVEGLWWGMMVGVFAQIVGQTVLAGKTDWVDQARRALARIDESSVEFDTKQSCDWEA